MTGLALGLMLGAGLFLVWSSFWVPPAERRVTRNRLRDRLADEIVQSGIPGLGVGTLIAFALGTFAIVFVIFQLVVGAAPLALCCADGRLVADRLRPGASAPSTRTAA